MPDRPASSQAPARSGVLPDKTGVAGPEPASAAGAAKPSPTAAEPAPERPPPAPTRAADAGVPAPTLASDAQAPPPGAPAAQPGAEPAGPTFDVVRVEPTGESVIAGRGPAGATIELLSDGEVHARAMADTSGLFALVPPPLAPGTHDIILQSIAPNGVRARSRDSVTIRVSEDRGRKPFVALASPDKPTVVLSAPDPGPAKAPDLKAPDLKASDPAVAAQDAKEPKPQPVAPGPRPPIKVVSVEAEEGGRLFVSGQAAIGATVRLYLNDTLIAPGGAGSDGRIAFAIGRGVKPGRYRVRLDDVDPVSGNVRSRAEVPFAVPEPLTVPLPPDAPPLVTNPPAVASTARPEDGPDEAGPVAAAPSRSTRGGAEPPAMAGAPEGPSERQAAAGGLAKASGARAGDAVFEAVLIPEVNTAIVSRGDNLWSISRRIYGRGMRYSVIYDANQDQIRNPDLIYPGQAFVLPVDPERAAVR